MDRSATHLMRRLYHVPIIHTLADMGNLGDAFRRASLQRLTVKAWRHKLQSIDEFWDKVEKAIEGLQLCYEHLKLYQDGLPVCGKEMKIVSTLAKQGSRNHKLLLSLVQRGAILMGTESSDLLLKEYQMIKAKLESQKRTNNANKDMGGGGSPDDLLAKRDGFIANRINTTLEAGETGLLFLGALHSPERFLDKDIVLKRLL